MYTEITDISAHMNTATKTKIIATIGPSSWDDNILRNMFREGMQIARINASFADYTELERVSLQLRKISPRIAILLDTQGTKIRIHGLEKEIEVKDSLTLTSDPNSEGIELTYPNLHNHITRRTRILLDDGNIELSVKEILGPRIICDVIQGGILKPNKTVNIPAINLNFPILTEKDKEDIHSAIKLDFDFICMSFTRNREDILAVRELTKGTDIKIVSKIENQEGLDNFEEILDVSDAIMIARGDLGVEIPLEDVPILQKKMIFKCRAAGKPVVVATQMLESMRESIRPTRAEVSDVANAVMDGTDAMMLSAETSTGKHPVEAISYMSKIARKSESVMQLSPIYGKTSASYEVDEISKNACNLSESIPLKSIIIISNSSFTVASVTRHRPNVPIYVVGTIIKRVRQNCIYRGVKTFHIDNLPEDRDLAIFKAIEKIYSSGELDFNDKVAIISGSSIKNSNEDLILEIASVKDILR